MADPLPAYAQPGGFPSASTPREPASVGATLPTPVPPQVSPPTPPAAVAPAPIERPVATEAGVRGFLAGAFVPSEAAIRAAADVSRETPQGLGGSLDDTPLAQAAATAVQVASGG